MELPAHYSRRFRSKPGYSNKDTAKAFLAAKDIAAPIDVQYSAQLIDRLTTIIKKLNDTIHSDAQQRNIEEFIKRAITDPAQKITAAGILPRLNNQGRRPEDVLFSWLRGYAIVEYFSPAIALIFGIRKNSLFRIGDDDFKSPETFKRTPTADLSAKINGRTVHFEIQSGFQGINDIKEHKLREARRLWQETGTPTICIHFDVFNGQTAFVRLDQIQENDINMVTRQQMEGQSVFAIDQNHFLWRLLDTPPSLTQLDLELP